MAPISLGWLTYPGDLLSTDSLAPDHEVVSGNTEVTSTLQKDNLTQQSVPSMPQFPRIWWRHTLPKKAILYLHRSSGSLGFSEAWPQPAHTACKHREAWTKIFLQEPASCRTPKALCQVISVLEFRVSEDLASLLLSNCGTELLQSSGHHPPWAYWGAPSDLPARGFSWQCPQSAPHWHNCCCWALLGQGRTDLPSWYTLELNRREKEWTTERWSQL